MPDETDNEIEVEVELEITTDPAGAPWDQEPYTRGDCLSMPRPCPFVTCRYHLAHDAYLSGKGGVGGRMFPRLRVINKDPSTMGQTCALDMADDGPSMIDEVADATGLTDSEIEYATAHAQRHNDGGDLYRLLTGREWDGEPAPKPCSGLPPRANETVEWAKKWLTENGPSTTRELYEAAESCGYSVVTLKRHRRHVGYKVERIGMSTRFRVWLPEVGIR